MEALKAFLEKHRAEGSQTHGSTPPHPAGGSHAVPPEGEAELLRLLTAAVAERPLTLYEAPLPSGMPLIVDLDLAVPLAERPKDGGRLFDVDAVGIVCKGLREAYATEGQLELGDANVAFYISQRLEGYESGGKWKDGVHIQSPDLWQPAMVHRIVRRKVLKVIEDQGASLSEVLRLPAAVTTSDEDIWDGRLTSGTQPWYLTGCGKAGAVPYMPTHKIVVGPYIEGDDYTLEPLDGTEDLLSELSLRRRGMPMVRCLLPEDDLAGRLAATHIGGGAAGGGFVQAEDFDPSLRPKVESLLALLSDGRAERMGFDKDKAQAQGCGEVVQAVFHILGPAGQDVALAFAQRSRRHWANAKAVAEAKAWFASVFHDSPGRNMGALCKWAAEDSPERFAEWKADQPSTLSAFGGEAGKLSPERTAKLLKEITSLSLEGVELVPDKGGRPFCSPFIYGDPADEAKAAAAGLNSLFVFQQPGTAVVLRSHLGTGKTTLFRALAADRNLKVLYISARRSFTRSMMGDFNDASKGDLGFRSYMGCENKATCSGDSCMRPEHVPQHFSPKDPLCRRFFCQVESLHKFYGDGLADYAYDLLVLDESESILASLQPGVTQKVHLLENMAKFERLVKAAKVVVAGDAFVSDRTMAMLKALRPSPPKLLLNTFNPYSGRVCERIKFVGPNKEGVIKQSLAKGKEHFNARIVKELDEGKRIVIVCASSDYAKSLEENLLKPRQLMQVGFTYKNYWAKVEDRDQRNKDLEDVNESWAGLNVLMYTPTITVGINYDNAERPFDVMFLYGGRMGPTVRDMFQASLRCRSLKENKVVFFLSDKGPAAHPVGLEVIDRNFRAVVDGSPLLKASARKEAEQQAALTLKKGGPAGGVVAAARGQLADGMLPPWYVDVLKRNTNEAAVCQTLPEEVYGHFLVECGYACPPGCAIEHVHKAIQFPQLEGEGLVVEKYEQLFAYADVPDIVEGTDEFNRIEGLLKADAGRLTLLDRQAMSKWRLKKRCGLLASWLDVSSPATEAARVRLEISDELVCQNSDEAVRMANCLEFKAICKAELAAQAAWATAEALDALWGTSTASAGYGRGDSGKFWHVAIEKLPPASAERYVHAQDAKDGFAALSDQLTGKFFLVQATLAALSLENSCEAKTFSTDEWNKLLPVFNEAKEWPDLSSASSLKVSSLLQRLKVTFELRQRRSADGNGPASHLQLDLNSVLSAWSGTEVKSKVVGEGKVRFFADGSVCGDVTEMEAEYKKAVRAELKADAAFSPLKGSPKTKTAPAAWEPGGSPSDRVNAIERRVGVAWQEEKVRLGISEPVTTKFYEFRTEPAFGGLLWAAVQPLEVAESVQIEE